ncbi:MAG: hypothetical protein COB35_03735 [Gammaproteobacteria bacterium]|nr:MAG: hypothetical protein COB35_03735 [Gammaproteobacteria bacterium]
MKEFVDVHDFLVSQAVVGDWDGEEELVAERLNEIFHVLYNMAEEDIETEELERLLTMVWHHWIGHQELPDLETDEILDWCQHVLQNREQYLEDY